MTDALRFRRPTQAVLDLSGRHGMKPKFVKDLVVGRREGEPRILQLLRLERR